MESNKVKDYCHKCTALGTTYCEDGMPYDSVHECKSTLGYEECPTPLKAPKNDVQEGKPKVSLIPMDFLIPMLCPAYEEGVEKYERESWRLGFDMSVMYDALMRHLKAFYFDHEDYDPEAVAKGYMKHHLGAVIFCAINMYNTAENFKHLDDRPKKDKTDAE